MDFRSPSDIGIARKLAAHPQLGENLPNSWNLTLCNEFHMTGDSDLYLESAGKGRLPLYEGKMIHQFEHRYAEPRYWVEERDGRARLLASRMKGIRRYASAHGVEPCDEGSVRLDYGTYRIGFRDVGPATNERSMIMTILPRKVFCPHTVSLEEVYSCCMESGQVDPNRVPLSMESRLYLCAVMNSFVVDSWLRRVISKHLSFFYVLSVPVPRLGTGDRDLARIVDRSARLICTTPEFDDLAKAVGLKNHRNGVTDPVGRAKLRAELDGLIAHLCGLTEEEFAHVLSTFPLVPDPVKVAAKNAYRDVERGLIR
jgi:hypothetical protein